MAVGNRVEGTWVNSDLHRYWRPGFPEWSEIYALIDAHTSCRRVLLTQIIQLSFSSARLFEQAQPWMYSTGLPPSAIDRRNSVCGVV
jgi:hypothetical protein